MPTLRMVVVKACAAGGAVEGLPIVPPAGALRRRAQRLPAEIEERATALGEPEDAVGEFGGRDECLVDRLLDDERLQADRAFDGAAFHLFEAARDAREGALGAKGKLGLLQRRLHRLE